jgi:hypothetical protein
MNKFWATIFIVYAFFMISGINMLKESGYEPLACGLKSSANGEAINDTYNAKLTKICAVKGTTIDTWNEFLTGLFVIPMAVGAVAVMGIRDLIIEQKGVDAHWQVVVGVWLFLLAPAIGASLRDLGKYLGKSYYILGWGFTISSACFGSWLYTGSYFNLGAMIISLLTLNVIGMLFLGMAATFLVSSIQSFFGGGK